MKITSIRTQVKNTNRYSVFVDGKYSFSLGADALLQSHLVTGDELTEADIRTYKKLSAEDKAFSLSLAFVVRRMRSEGELQDYFNRKEYAPELAEQITGRLKKLNFVDDEEFARRWVENRRLLKATSTKKLRLELRQKKVSNDIIQKVLGEDQTDERSVLRGLVEKKRKLTKYRDDPQKLMRYLASQGFGYDDIKSVLADTTEW